MNDDTFARLVAEEVKNRVSQSQSDYLRLPDNWTRWQRALVALSENLNRQVQRIDFDEAADKERYEALGEDGSRLLAEATADYENRRTKIKRFQFHVDNRLDEVTKMIAMGIDAAGEDIGQFVFLRKAIETHRTMMSDYDLEPTGIDTALWDALDGKWSFDSVDAESLSLDNG